MTKCGIIRGESLFWCELTDFWGYMKSNEEPHPLHCVFMTIFQGEMDPNRTLYEGFCRSVNERLCSVGGILMYLFKR